MNINAQINGISTTLLNGHAAANGNGDGVKKSKSARKVRKMLVCLPCRRRKLKCDKERPVCTRCRQSNQDCLYAIGDGSELSPTEPKGATNSTESTKPLQSFGLDNLPSVDIFDKCPVTPGDSYSSHSDIFARYDSLPNITIRLWDRRYPLVYHNSVTYMDTPLAEHALMQMDPLMNSLAVMFHGSCCADFSKLRNLQTAINVPLQDDYKFTYPLSDELNPLCFIEGAISKVVKQAERRNKFMIPLDFVYVPRSLDNNMNPKVMGALKTLTAEIEVLLTETGNLSNLLRIFYEDIYPFYAFMDIDDFENDVGILLAKNNFRCFNIDLLHEDIRHRIETLTLLLIVLTMSLRRVAIEPSNCHIPNAAEVATHMEYLSQKLLGILNGLKLTNERVFCCMLYALVSDYLDPDSEEILYSHSSQLRLKCLTNLAITLGLHINPSKVKRFHREFGPNPKIVNFRRKLWVGLQMFRLQVVYAAGDCNRSDLENLENFYNGYSNMIDMFRDPPILIDDAHEQLLQNFDSKYKLSLYLNTLMVSLMPADGNINLFEVLQNLKRAKDFVDSNFPLSKLGFEMALSSGRKKEMKTHRNATIDLERVLNTEILLINMIAKNCFTSVYYTLTMYFEKECSKDWKTYEKYYHIFFVDLTRSFRELKFITHFNDHKYAGYIPAKYNFVINKLTIFTSTKVWIMMICILLKFSYYLKDKKLQDPQRWNIQASINEEDESCIQVEGEVGKFFCCYNKLKHGLKEFIDSFSVNLSNTYMNAFCCVSILKYVVTLLDQDKVYEFSRHFYERAFIKKDISSDLLKDLNMKWGLDMSNPVLMKEYFLNPKVSSSFNSKLLDSIKDVLKTYEITSPIDWELDKQSESKIVDEALINQILETKMDLFWGV